MSKKLHILFLCSWYPSRVLPTNGDFIKRHAEAISTLNDVSVLHIISDKTISPSTLVATKDNNVNTFIGYVRYTSNPLVKYIRFTRMYKKAIRQIASFDIIHLNVRSIRNKIDSLNAIVSDFDIACFTETHLDHKISDNDILLDGFDTIFRKDRNSYGGGVIIYTSNNIRSRRRIDLEPGNTECIWIEIDNLTSRLLLCCVYRPPHADSAFWRNFSWSLDKASEISDKS